MPEATVPIALVHRLLRTAGNLGFDTSAICHAAGVDPHDQRSKLLGAVSLYQLARLWEGIMLVVREPGFPVRVAGDQSLEAYGVVMLGALTRRNLGDGLQHLIQTYRLWTRSSLWQLHHEAGSIRLEFCQNGPLRLGLRCDQEFSLAEMTSAIRVGLGRPDWAPRRVCLRHRRPQPIEQHEEFFGAPLVFEHPRVELVIDARDLALPMVRADHLLAGYFEQQAALLLAETRDRPDDFHLVEAAVRAAIERGVPRLETVASQLGMSPRTVRRRLEARTLSFKALVERIRRDMAMRLLADPEITISEISHQVGFSEPSAFHRAFRRWTGAAPERFRTSGGDIP